MRWSLALEGGPRRVNHAAVNIGDNVYSFGGYCTGENYRTLSNMDVHVLNTMTYRWKIVEISQMQGIVPFQRYGHTVVPFGSGAYLWGGRNDIRACNKLYCFNTVSRQWSVPEVHGSIPEARDGHSACLINDCMYIFAGYVEVMDSYTQDVHMFNFRTMTWHFVITSGMAPIFRDFHTATGVGSIMYVWGGREIPTGQYEDQNAEEYGNDLYVLDTDTGQWSAVCTVNGAPIGRRSHSAWVHADNIYFFGGYNGQEQRHFNDIIRYNITCTSWEQVRTHGTPPCPRRRQSCCLVGSKVFLFGGTSPRVDDGSAIPVTDDENADDPEYLGPPNEGKLMDHNDLHVLDLEPTLKTLCLIRVSSLKLDASYLPYELQVMLKVMTTPNNISPRTTIQTG